MCGLGAPRDELRRVVELLCLGDAALEVARKCLLTPGRMNGVGDGSEGGGGAVLVRRGGKVERERAVAAHRVAEYRLAREIL